MYKKDDERSIDQCGQWVYYGSSRTGLIGMLIGDEFLVDILDKMNPDKRIRLINAAMKEFGEYRFEKASTNAIVKEAGISKGLLYHYFSSKKDLYTYLFDYTIKAIALPIAEQVGLEDRDVIRRIERIAKLKVKIIEEMPALLSFSKTMYTGMGYEDVKKVIAKHNPIPLDMYYSHNVDESLFKEGVDVAMAIKTIQYTLEKVSEGYMTQRNMGIEPDIDVVIHEVEGFLAHFRDIYYQ